jgi:hypothetical protein
MMHEFIEKSITKKNVIACLVDISFSASNALTYCYYSFLRRFFDFRHAYPETAYITATPTGTIGPITVSLF